MSLSDIMFAQVEDTEGEKIRNRREVIHGQKSWQDLQPRRVRTLIGCTGKDETAFLPSRCDQLPGWQAAGLRAPWMGRWAYFGRKRWSSCPKTNIASEWLKATRDTVNSHIRLY